MLDVKYMAISVWEWIVVHGLTLAALLIVGMLIPRVARLLIRFATNRLMRDDEGKKSWTALVGAGVYLLEVFGYFIVVYAALKNLGVSTVGAAVPATVVSAAVGFGAQKVIGDFLAGFFIISEHQYGVGDTVSFDGTSDQVMGKVVRLTLRATQIRTGKGELITVPNSEASVTINYSQQWSRAVVDIEVPMRDGDTMASLSDTVYAAAEDAIEAAGIHDDILGEIDVLPAMSITAPTAAGLPWTVGMEVTVDVNPATQWMVQRTIRSAVITAFWDRFQAPGRTVDRQDVPTQEWPPVTAEQIAAASDHGEQGPDDAATPDAADPGEQVDTSVEPVTDTVAELAEDVERNGIWRNEDHRSRIKRILSVKGRVRPSTTVLFAVLLIVGLIGLFAADPKGGEAGVLSPHRFRDDTDTVVPTESTPTGDASATGTPTDETEVTPTETDTTGTDGTGTANRNQQSEENSSGTDTNGSSGDNGGNGSNGTTGTGNQDSGQQGTDNSGGTGNGQGTRSGGTDSGTGEADPQQQSLGRSAGAGDSVPIPSQGGQAG
jgi:small-conductance mechanosensitive channel